MRKLILIAAIATMSSSACYANLSLASNEPQPTIVAPSAQALEAKAQIKAEARAESPVKAPRTANVSRPKPQHQAVRAFVIRRSYDHCL